MKSEEIMIIVLAVIVAIFLLGAPFNFYGMHNGYGGYGMMSSFYGSYGMMSNFYNGFGFIWLICSVFITLLIIILVLAIIWLTKQVQQPRKGRK